MNSTTRSSPGRFRSQEGDEGGDKANMRVHLHVRDKIVTVECGAGTQKTKWLANVGVARYDDNFGRSLGAPRGIQKEGGTLCDPMMPINKALGNGQHCFVVLNDFVGQEQQGTAASAGSR
eukprot:GILI01025653.1.p1 GENE.GILI01025653.1~~GILI01025653.1.p1  ORF type:complete len:130 (-),score=20.52 GILI01025653.1:47-406(-)